jgi:hypothetical protein
MVAEGFGHGFGFGVHLQLPVNVAQMKADGVHTAAQFGSSGLVAV